MDRRLSIALVMAIAAGAAACGPGAPSPVPSSLPGPTPTAVPIAVPVPTPIPVPVPTAVPVPTRAASSPGAAVAGTITLGDFGQADGPGISVGEALGSAAIGRPLVNGILLEEADGTFWLCDALRTSPPPDCAEPRLLVVNMPQSDEAFVNGSGLHDEGGVRWREQAQLYGDVRPSAVAASASPEALATPEPTEFALPTPVCPAPLIAVKAPDVTVSVGDSVVRATTGSSGFLTCSTSATSDAAPTDPTVGVIARPGDLMTLSMPANWRILRWEGYDHKANGEGTNVSPPIDTPERPSRIEVPVPLRSGDSIAGYHLSLVSADGRAVGGLDILIRVSVQ
jgi:hypothetical protein